MTKFKDSQGNEWHIALPIGEVKRVEKVSEGRFCLIDPTKDNLAQRLDADLMEFYDLLQILCDPQAEERGLTAEQFGRIMAADCLLDAQKAFFEEWQDFFQKLGRAEFARGVALLALQRRTALELLSIKVQESEALIQKAIDQSANEMERALGIAFGKMRELTESPSAISTSSTS